MSRRIAPFIDIVRLEDKETKLKAFITTVIEQNAASGASGNDVLLVVRSVDSPVAKAVAALVQDGTIATPVKTILAIVPRSAEEEAAALQFMTVAREHGGRAVRDVRLFDAHEQLVLGPAASWIGDCMRRDPMKRDAYECYAADCAKTAGWALTSFDRLWNACQPLPEPRTTPADVVIAGQHIGAVIGDGPIDEPAGSTT